MAIIPRIISKIGQLGFIQTATFLRAIYNEGKYSDGKTHRHFNLSRGLARCLFYDKAAASKVTARTALSSHYLDSGKYESWKDIVEWPGTKIITKLIEEGPLNGEPLKVLDVGCHRGGLLDDLTKPGKISRYTGIDLSSDAVQKAREKHPEYNFLILDALIEENYRNSSIKNDNNVIVCTGFCDYLSPREIKLLLSLLTNKLSSSTDSRIYLSYATTKPNYAIYNPADKENLEWLNRFNNEACRPNIEDSINYLGTNYVNGSPQFYRYSPDEFIKLIESCGFEIDPNNSMSNYPRFASGDTRELRKLGRAGRVHAYDHIAQRRK